MGNVELKALLDEDLRQTSQSLNKKLHTMEKIQKKGKWVPREEYKWPGF